VSTNPTDGSTPSPPLPGTDAPPTGLTPLGRAGALLALSLLPFLVARSALALAYGARFSELSALDFAGAFVAGLRFDLAALLPFAIGPLGLLLLPPVARHRPARLVIGWLGFLPLPAFCLLLGGDLFYFGEVQRHMGRELALIAHDMGYLVAMVGEHWLALVVSLLLVGLIGLPWWWLLTREHRDSARPYAIFVLAIALGVLGIRGSLSRKPISAVDAYRSGGFQYGNLCLNGVFTSLRASLKANRAPKNPLERGEAFEALGLDASSAYPIQRAPGARRAGLPEKPNMVVVLLESWDVRFMGCYGAEESCTPRFDAWAKRALVFDNAYAATQRTIGGIQATLTGLPCVPGVPELGHGLEHTNVTRIGKLARDLGYRSFFLQVPRRRSYYLDSVALSLGFEQAYGFEDYPVSPAHAGEFAKWGWDDDGFDFALKRIDELQEPFLVVMLSGTTHSPYARTSQEFELDPHETHGVGGFKNTLRYSDAALGRLREAARERPWDRNTVWIASADHVFRSASDDLRESFRIPFLLDVPGQAPGRRPEVRSQYDILPTLVELLGTQEPSSTYGTSLLGPPPPLALVKLGSVLGAITDQGYLTHTIDARLSTKGLAEAPAAALERRLLAIQRVTTTLVQANRWAP